MKYFTFALIAAGFCFSESVFANEASMLLPTVVTAINLKANGLDKIPANFTGGLSVEVYVDGNVLTGNCTPNGPAQFVVQGPSGVYSLGYQPPQCPSAAATETVSFESLQFIVRDSSELNALKSESVTVNGKSVSLSSLF